MDDRAEAEIVVSRPGGHYRDSLRGYGLHIDGSERAKIRAAETVRIRVSPGRHTIVARVDWTSSRPLEVECAPGQRVEVRVEPNGGAFTALMSVFMPRDYLRLRPAT